MASNSKKPCVDIQSGIHNKSGASVDVGRFCKNKETELSLDLRFNVCGGLKACMDNG